MHTLLGLANKDQLLGHPIVGSSWEGFALETVMLQEEADERDCYFWATHNRAELDELRIVYPGEEKFQLADKVFAVPLG